LRPSAAVSSDVAAFPVLLQVVDDAAVSLHRFDAVAQVGDCDYWALLLSLALVPDPSAGDLGRLQSLYE
jgi:hypothetical protein